MIRCAYTPTCSSEIVVHIRRMYTMTTAIVIVILFTTSHCHIIVHHTWVVVLAVIDELLLCRAIQA